MASMLFCGNNPKFSVYQAKKTYYSKNIVFSGNIIAWWSLTVKNEATFTAALVEIIRFRSYSIYHKNMCYGFIYVHVFTFYVI